MSVLKTARAALLLSFTLATAAAQDGDGLRPLDPDGIDDVGGWLDEEQAAPTPPPSSGGDDPLAGPGSGAAAPAPQSAELSPEEQRKRGREIDRNYEKAQEIYQGIINGDKLEPLERRIANNEHLIREYNQKIGAALAERRELQVQVFNQSFYLKEQVDRGQITQPVYDELIAKEEDKYERRVAELKANVGLWRREVAASKQRLANLKAQARMVSASRPKLRRKRAGKQGEPAPKVRPGERLLSSLQARLRKLNAFQTKNTLSNVHPRDLGSQAVLSRERPSDDAADDGGSLETPPQEDESFWED